MRLWRHLDQEPLHLVESVGTPRASNEEPGRLSLGELAMRTTSDLEGTSVAIPLHFDSRLLGLLTVTQRQPPTEDQRAWLQIVAECLSAALASHETVARLEVVRAELQRENAELHAEVRDTFEEAPIPYVHEGLDTRFIRANRAAQELLGISPQDVATTYGRTFVAENAENQRRLDQALAEVARGSDTRHAVLELRRKDNGKPIWVQWWSQPRPGRSYTRTMMVDITDRILLEQTRNTLELSLKSGQIGDWDLDLSSGLSRRSLRHDQCFGYDHGISERDWGVDGLIQRVAAEDRERVERSMRKAIAALSNWTSEFRVVWPDGKVHWLAAHGAVHRTIDGKAERMLGVILDISERVASEEALRETKAALDFALESAQVGDWDLDLVRDTSRRSLRHDRCFGYSQPIPEKAWGAEVFRKHIHPLDRDRVLNSMREAIGTLADWSAEFRVIWPDESLHWLVARGSVYRGVEGPPKRMLGVVMDISDRKRVEEALSASEQFARGQVEVLRRTLDAVARESLPEKIIEHVLRTITEHLGARSTSVWRLDHSTGFINYECAFESGELIAKDDERLVGIDLRLPTEAFWPWQQVLASGRPGVMEDIREMKAFPFRERALAQGIVTIMVVPMLIAGRVEGEIGIRFAEKRAFTAEEMNLAQALVNQATLVLELKRLSAESLATAVVEERNRLARDIHDTLAQGFTGIIVQLEAAKDAASKKLTSEADSHLHRASQLARDSLQEARRSLQALRPQELDDKSLTAAMAGLIRSMTDGSGVRAQFVVNGTPRELPPDWETNLLRIGQEVTANMLRHSRAHRFDVALTFAPREVQLDLRDDGAGFDPSLRYEGFGLVGIRERVDRMEGTIAIRSSRSNGVGISIAVPLPHASPAGVT